MAGGRFCGALSQRCTGKCRNALRVELPPVGFDGIIFSCAAGERHIHGDACRETENIPRQCHPVTPRAVERHKQMVATVFGRKSTVFTQDIAKLADTADKLAFGSSGNRILLRFFNCRVHGGNF